MAFNFGGFLGGVAEGVNDAILREEERLDDKLALNRQEASLQRREKNRARLQEETLLKELTEQLAGLGHTESEIEQMASKGLGGMKQFAKISEAEYQAGRDPSGAYTFAVATADIAKPPSASSIGGAAKSDNLEQTTIQPTSFGIKPRIVDELEYSTVEEKIERLTQQLAVAITNGDQKAIDRLTKQKETLVTLALTEGDGSGIAKQSTYTAIIEMERRAAFSSNKGYDIDPNGALLNLKPDDRGRVAVDTYTFGKNLMANPLYAKDNQITAYAEAQRRQAKADAKAFADAQYVSKGKTKTYFTTDADKNYHVIDVSGAGQYSDEVKQRDFVEKAFKKYKQTNKIAHGSAIIYKATNDSGQNYKAGGGVYSFYEDTVIDG